MKNRILLSLVVLLCIYSCQSQEVIDPETRNKVASTCGVSDPQELSWFEEAVTTALEDPNSDYCTLKRVIQGNYKGETVFILQVSGALCCTCGDQVVNCENETVLLCDREEQEKIADQEIIWEITQ